MTTTPFKRRHKKRQRQQQPLRVYFDAVTTWKDAGQPERSDKTVKKIYEQLCKDCFRLSSDGTQCRSCGCVISGNEPGLLKLLTVAHANGLINKIRMATEHCPLERW